MRTVRKFAAASALIGIALIATDRGATSQERGVLSVAAGYAADLDALRRWDATLDSMARTGELVAASRRNDAFLEGRTHEYLAQYHAGIPVHGGGVSRQLDAGGVTVSMFGTLYRGIDVDTAPALSGPEVAARIEALHGGEVVAVGQPSLTILPRLDGSFALTYLVATSDWRFHFADADLGRIVHSVDAVRRQAAVGVGTGFEGDVKKLSTMRSGSRFEARDLLRPGEIVTLDAQYDGDRLAWLLYGHLLEGLPAGESIWTADDVASDPDNNWGDAAVVDAHAHAGWAYDYFSQRHGWAGMDGENGRMLSIVNFDARGSLFLLPPFGPEGTGVSFYGTSRLETGVEPWTKLDHVAHETTHGVSFHAVRERTGSPIGLVDELSYAGGTMRLGPPSFTDHAGETHSCDTTVVVVESPTPEGPEDVTWPAICVDGRFFLASAQGWAVDEAYADLFAASIGFFHGGAGAAADYVFEGDRERPVLRSMADPLAVPLPEFPLLAYPDTYGDRYEFAHLWHPDEDRVIVPGPFVFQNGQYAFTLPFHSYGGAHWNSTILSHAFYLAVEGGTHRTSGMQVEGVGGDNREEIEHIFFRAMTELMPASTSLPTAAAVIRQAAFDLAPGSDAQRAVDQALRAVGLAPGIV